MMGQLKVQKCSDNYLHLYGVVIVLVYDNDYY